MFIHLLCFFFPPVYYAQLCMLVGNDFLILHVRSNSNDNKMIWKFTSFLTYYITTYFEMCTRKHFIGKVSLKSREQVFSSFTSQEWFDYRFSHVLVMLNRLRKGIKQVCIRNYVISHLSVFTPAFSVHFTFRTAI